MRFLDFLKPITPEKPEVQIVRKDKLSSLHEFPREVQDWLRARVKAEWHIRDSSEGELRSFEKWQRSDDVTTYIARDAHHAFFYDMDGSEYIGHAIVDLVPAGVFVFYIHPGKRHQMFATHLLITMNAYVSSMGDVLRAGRPAQMTVRGERVDERRYHDAHQLWGFLVKHGFAKEIVDTNGDITFRFKNSKLDKEP